LNPGTLHLDQSDARRGLCILRDGRRLTLEDAFEQGLVVTPADAPAVLTLLTNFVEVRDRCAK
jgi:hypothetical protein